MEKSAGEILDCGVCGGGNRLDGEYCTWKSLLVGEQDGRDKWSDENY